MDLLPGPDVPQADTAISAPADHHVQLRVQRQTVHSAQMAMEVTDHFVVFQIPTFHSLVLTTAV